MIGAWLLALAAGFLIVATLVDGTLTTEFHFFSNPESKQADTLLEERLRGPADVNEVVIVRAAGLTVDDAAYRDFVERIRTEIEELGDDVVADVTSYFKDGNESLVSENRMTTI